MSAVTPPPTVVDDAPRRVAALQAEQMECWQRGEPIPAERFLERLTGGATLGDDLRDDAFDLIYGEWLLRVEAGETPSLVAFAARFPDFADLLREQLALDGMIGPIGDRTAPTVPTTDGDLDRPTLPGYEIVRELGRGGMGVVYEAVEVALQRRVAVKVLPPRLLTAPTLVARFRREAAAAARLHHTNIVPVFGTGEHKGVHYYVMQYIESRGIGDDAPEPRSAARLCLQAAEALAYAHAHGVLHRDVKPANLLLDASGTVWIADFGLAKVVDEAEALTATGDIVGTVAYMAPERFGGGGDARADVYALGLVLYELLTKRRAFADADPLRLLDAIKNDAPPRPRAVVPTLPRDLETITLKAIERDPARRYASAQLFADDLRRFLDDRPIQARRTSALAQVYRWARRNPAVATSLVAVVGVVLAALALVSWQLQLTERARAAEARRATSEEAAHKAADAARADEEKARKEAQRQALRLLLGEAQVQCRGPDAAVGRHRLLYGLEKAQESGDADFERVFRAAFTGGGETQATLRILVHSPQPRTYALAFGPDDTSFVTVSNHGRVWDADTGKERDNPRPALVLPAGVKTDVVVHPTKAIAAVAFKDGNVFLFAYATGQRLAALPKNATVVDGLAFDRDGTALAVASRSQVQIWDVTDPKTPKTKGPPLRFAGRLHLLAWGGGVIAGGGDFGVQLLAPARALTGTTRFGTPATALAFSPSGEHLASGHADGSVRRWVVPPQGRVSLTEAIVCPDEVAALRFSDDGQAVFVGCRDRSVHRYRFLTRAPLARPCWLSADLDLRHERRKVAFGSDGRTLLSHHDGTRLWDLPWHKERETDLDTEDSLRNLHAALFAPDGRTVVASAEAPRGRTALFETTTGRHLLRGEPAPRNPAFAFFREGEKTYLLQGDGDRLLFWDLTQAEGKPARTLKFDARVLGVASSPDGRRLAIVLPRPDRGASGTRLFEVDPAKGPEPLGPTMPGGANDARAVLAYRPVGEPRLAAGGQLYDPTTGTPRGERLTVPGQMLAAAFSPDGTTLLTAGPDHAIRFWDGDNGAPRPGTALTHTGAVHGLSFSPDGRTVLTCSVDRTARLWDVATRLPLTPPLTHPGPVLAGTFDADGTKVTTVCEDGGVRRWPVPQPVAGDVARLRRELEIATGLAMDARAEGITLLRADAWQRQRLPSSP